MVGRWIVSLSVATWLVGASTAEAAPKVKGKPAAAKPAAKPAAAKPKKGKEAEKEKEQEKDKPDEQPTVAEDAKTAAKEESLKAAGTAAPKSQSAGDVKVKEDKEGVKTYKFETVEVEGRLKSPQVIYFLRRVRAEFEAGALGHRSFLGELSDSRRSAALR
jgi:phosphopantetheinyl transferase (holo-ACP synthase)